MGPHPERPGQVEFLEDEGTYKSLSYLPLCHVAEQIFTNIAMLDNPPPEPVEEPPPTAADAIAETQAQTGPEVPTWCGCQAPLGAVGGLWLAGLGLVGWRRR